jgi:valyl-tRNA synthetase
MAQRFFSWVDDMHDWCISRQLWWGHRIPVWYGPDGAVVVPGPDEEPPSGEGWQQDEDVLDTWFSSALWPMSTLGWPDETEDLRRFYPTSVLVTGYDIIFFWVARMMMFCTYALPEVPFRQVVIHGLVRDERGKKMSKSSGNVIDPLELIDRYGADALRFTLARGANPGTDIPLSIEWVEGSRNFINKVWNATRFALMNGARVTEELPSDLSVADRWILARLDEVTAEVDEHYEVYEWAKAVDALFHFAWDDVFDWYVELAKVPLRAGGPAADTVRVVLGHVLDRLLRMLHPVVPFVSEELWVALTGQQTLVTAAWPTATGRRDPDAAAEIARVQTLVTELRRFRQGQGLRPGQKVPAVLVSDAALAAYCEQIGALTDLRLSAADSLPAGWATLDAGGVHVALDLSGAIDVAAERARIGKQLDATRKELAQVEGKLGNASFVDKAPPAVVDKTRQRREDALHEIDRLQRQLDALPVS